MISLQIYKQIKERQSKGETQTAIAKTLGISRDSVAKWWRKGESEFTNCWNSAHREQLVLESYKTLILDLIKLTPQIKTTNILYRIKKDNPSFNPQKHAFYRFVKQLREEAGLLEFTKKLTSVKDKTEMAEEAQIDFGEMKLKTMYGTRVKVHFFAGILSYSNFRFVYFQAKSFTTRTAIKAHNLMFRFFCGRPQRLLYDLDGVFARSENYGDIILAKEFEEYARRIGYQIVFTQVRCPEQKSKVEGTVKLTKAALAGHIYTGVDALNIEALRWLDTTGNEIVCGRTRLSPRDAFREEQPHLIKVNHHDIKDEQKVFHIASQNTVFYKGNQYELPKGTNLLLNSVEFDIVGNGISFYNPDTHEFLCSHILSPPNQNAISKLQRAKIESVSEETLRLRFAESISFDPFIAKLKEQKGRYFNKQCGAILLAAKFYSNEQIEKGFEHCLTTGICGFTELMAFLVFKHGKEKAKKVLSKEKWPTYFKRATELEVHYGK